MCGNGSVRDDWISGAHPHGVWERFRNGGMQGIQACEEARLGRGASVPGDDPEKAGSDHGSMDGTPNQAVDSIYPDGVTIAYVTLVSTKARTVIYVAEGFSSF